MQQMMVLAQAKLLQASNQETSVPQADKPVKAKEEKVDSVDISGPKDKTETKTIVAIKGEAKTKELFSKETTQSLFCKPTKKALREAEISQALSFYKNSSYYGFNEGI